MYEYKATLLRVIDGDTVVLDVDLGMMIHVLRPCRLHGIDAPEKRALPVAAENARARLVELLQKEPLLCRTHKDSTEKYGRLLVTLTNGEGEDINATLLAEGFVVKYG